MLSKYRVACALPAKDLERAKDFYKTKLGMSPDRETEADAWYECAEGTGFLVFISTGQSRGEFTQLGFEVDDVETVVQELKERGVEFEQYDFPGFKTDANGIVTTEDGQRGAWFKDTEGNLLSLGQNPT